MEDIVSQVHKLLIKRRKTIGIAESCTGGLLSGLLTRMPGSSRYFILGLVAYSNKVKEDMLRIPRSIINKNGAVSRVVASRMAHSVRETGKADFGIGITGIAGPSGGSPGKPVGTVFIAIDSKTAGLCKQFQFKGSRIAIRKTAALKALELLKRELER